MSIEVQPGGYMRSESDNLVARNVYTYLALALRVRRSASKHVGYLGYFPPDEGTDHFVREMIGEALDEAGSPERLSAWPAGCAPFALASPETKDTKDTTMSILAKYEIPVVEELWIPASSLAISSFRLYCAQGAVGFTLQHMRNWEE